MVNPTYSVCIPVYRRTYGFREAVESALAVKECQEIVVVDDNSDHDQFETICRSFNDIRIRYHRNEENLGLFANWNKGIRLAKGDFVSILCSDDLIGAEAFSSFLTAYRSNPSVDVFFGSFCTFTESVDDLVMLREFPKGKIQGVDLIRDVAKNGPGFPVLSIIRRSTALKLPFVSKPHSGNDWLWIYSNASALNLHAVDQPINYWRRHPDQDAVRSQSVTTDCWPLMYIRIAEQLEEVHDPYAGKALRRAKGVILTWLLNEFKVRQNYYPRLKGREGRSNRFLRTALDIIHNAWLLLRILQSEKNSTFYYNLGRVTRKAGYYPNS